MPQPDLGDQPLEPKALLRLGTGFAEVVVDDLDTFPRPAQTDRAIDQPILQRRAFLMMPDLTDARLPDIDIGQLGTMDGVDLIIR